MKKRRQASSLNFGSGPFARLTRTHLVLAAIGLLVLATGAVWLATSQAPGSGQAAINPARVNITAQGFVPATITIARGQAITWTNSDTAPHGVSSDPYPRNNGLPGLNSANPLLTNNSFTYVFDKTGTFTYHDQQNPLKVLGTVHVQ
ncbi:MAG TPA: cupredoxin domain-containing protein [Candidatus Saccharimonadia bacterium]